MKKVLFKEEQDFRQWWMWALIVTAFTLPLLIIGVELAGNSNNTAEEITILSVVMAVLVVVELAIIWLFGTSKLQTEIVDAGIRFRFPPLVKKWKRINKSEIAYYEVRQYKPVLEYGGWGIKAGRRKSGRAYNVSGNIGLQLYLKNGKKLLLGTQKRQAIKHAMEKLFVHQAALSKPETLVGKEKRMLLSSKTKKVLFIGLIEIVLAIVIFSLIQIFK